MSRLPAAHTRLLVAWDTRRVWADDGSKTPPARLSRECDLSARTARCEMARARKRKTRPGPRGALREGKLSIDQAHLLTHANQPEFAELFARDEQLLVDNLR